MSQDLLQYPIITFRPSFWKGASNAELSMEWFEQESYFCRLEEQEIESKERVGMEVFDATGKHFKVTGVSRVQSLETSLWARLWTMVVGRYWLIRHDMVTLPSVTFEELRERTALGVLGEPDRWRDDEAVAGESGVPRDEQEMLDELAARVRAAADIHAVIKVLDNPDPDVEA